MANKTILLLAAIACLSLIRFSIGNDADLPHISLVQQESDTAFQVEGLSDQTLEALKSHQLTQDEFRTLFSVHLAGAKEHPPALLGDYEIRGDNLVFVPRFRLRPGQTYEARLELDKLPAIGNVEHDARIVQKFTTEDHRRTSEPTQLLVIYPGSKVLPENQLKFYLHFSKPMSRGVAYKHIHLFDQNDQEVEFAFLALPEELWDPECKRFTLFFDPGRIKRGLKPREEFGPSIIEGQTYTLVVDQDWPDGEGRPLREGQRKAFSVVAPDDTQPDPSRWKLISPKPETKTPLVVHFDEPLDHAMLHRVLSVQDATGTQIMGEVETSENETRWSFRPVEPWREGQFQLVIDTRLEDLGGNSIARPFEVDLFDTVQKEVPSETVHVPFDVGDESLK